VQIIFSYFAQMMAVLAQNRSFSGGKTDFRKNVPNAHPVVICASKHKHGVQILFINSSSC